MAVCRARELLAAVVASEEAIIAHQSICSVCRSGGVEECLEAVNLVMSCAESMLAAKFYLDRTDPVCGCSESMVPAAVL
jgi:hypothetical protein